MLLLTIGSWWNALSGVQQTFWTIAIVFSILLLIQFVFLLTSSDIDTNADSAELRTTITTSTPTSEVEPPSVFARTSITFFAFFGWTGIIALNAGSSIPGAVLIASIIGLLTMLLLNYVLWELSTSKQEPLTQELLAATGEVSVDIPATKKGKGRVLLHLQDSLPEVAAITKDGQPLLEGVFIRVVEVQKDKVVVELIDE